MIILPHPGEILPLFFAAAAMTIGRLATDRASELLRLMRGRGECGRTPEEKSCRSDPDATPALLHTATLGRKPNQGETIPAP